MRAPFLDLRTGILRDWFIGTRTGHAGSPCRLLTTRGSINVLASLLPLKLKIKTRDIRFGLKRDMQKKRYGMHLTHHALIVLVQLVVHRFEQNIKAQRKLTPTLCNSITQ